MTTAVEKQSAGLLHLLAIIQDVISNRCGAEVIIIIDINSYAE